MSNPTLRLYSPEGFANKLEADNEGNIRAAIIYFVDMLKEGNVVNNSEWCASVMAHLLGRLAAKAI